MSLCCRTKSPPGYSSANVSASSPTSQPNIAQTTRFRESFEEALAALEDLAQQFAPSSQSWNAVQELEEFRTAVSGQVRRIVPEVNGPYLVTNVAAPENLHGEPIAARPEMALCRCGGSVNKPFCDGTHSAIGFESCKLDGRTPDRRGSYAGDQITVFDNRGICQHAGDNLPSVFKLHREP